MVLSSVHYCSKIVHVADKISVPSASWGSQSFLGGQTMVEPTAGTEKLLVPLGHLPTSGLTQGGQHLEGSRVESQFAKQTWIQRSGHLRFLRR